MKVGVVTESRAEYGVIENLLHMLSEDDKIDMVVMMTHGRSGIKRFLMGSLAEEMLRRQCKVPILMITSKAAENFPCE